MGREPRHRDTFYGLSDWSGSGPHDVEIGLTAEQQNGDEGEAKRRKYVDGGAGNFWFGYCVVHMFRYGRSSYLTAGPTQPDPGHD